MRARFPWQALFDYFTPTSFLENPEAVRRARLIVGFGITGSIFGPIYAIFYLFIGHVWGAAIIAACTLAMASVPWILKKSVSLALPGNLHAFILVLGFAGLTAIEGGVHGHAIAWLASVPLCVLLLVGSRSARVWCAVCFLVTLLFCGLESLNIITPILYPARWHSAVTAAGFLGLVIFMAVIGLIFETGRKRAFRKMQEALHELSRSNAQLRELDAEKNEILDLAAHDLKSPLNAIMGFARLIVTKDSASAERVKEDADEILQASTQMYHLVSDLLDLQAIEQGHFFLGKETVALADLAEASLNSHRPIAEAKQIAVELQRPAEPAVIEADRGAMLQVLNNLVSNAIKFSPLGRKVIVRVKASGGESVLEVQDEGPGISPEDRAQLFGKFARLSARPTAGESSTGLGLSIVKRLVESMGGTVHCRSNPGEGATFSVHFPHVSMADKTPSEGWTAPGVNVVAGAHMEPAAGNDARKAG
jgi:signal transduction histidine kinase